MIKRIIFLIIFINSFFLYALDKVIVSGHDSRPPFDWNENDKLVGAGIDIITMIFKELNIDVEARYTGPWIRTLKCLEDGSIDIMCGLYINDERKTFAEFTEPFSKDEVTVFVLKNKYFKFKTWEDLKGKVFGDITGATRGKEFDDWRIVNAKIEYVSTIDQNIKKLLSNRIDCFVTSYYLGLMNIRKMGFSDMIIPLEKPAEIKYLQYGISKKSKFIKYIPLINKKINEMKKNGTIDRLIKKNLDYYIKTNIK